MVKVIRFANEGFTNHKHMIKIDGVNTEIEGCYVFIDKIIKKALRYEKTTIRNNPNLINRDKDKKNIGYVLENAYVYCRIIDPDKLFVVTGRGEICVQPESLGDKIDEENMVKVTLGEFYENVKKYEIFEKKIKAEAKKKGFKVAFFNTQYYYYEAIVDGKDVQVLSERGE